MKFDFSAGLLVEDLLSLVTLPVLHSDNFYCPALNYLKWTRRFYLVSVKTVLVHFLALQLFVLN